VTGDGETVVDVAIDRPPAWTLREDPLLELDVVAGRGLRRTSSLTVSVDGRDVGTQRLVPGARRQRLAFRLPRGLLDTDPSGGAVRTIALALRFDLDTDRRTCEPLDVDGVRAVLLDTSRITLPHQTTDALDLSRFPAPLGGRTAIVLPNAASADERSAGLQLAAALGRWSPPGTPLPRLTTAQALGGDRARADLVLVGGADKQLGRDVAAPDGAAGEPGSGMLLLRESPWADGRHVLAVDGEGEGLLNAARALTARQSVERLIGTAVRVRETRSPEAIAAASPAGRPPLLLAPVEERGTFDRVPVWAVPAAVVLVVLLLIGWLVIRRRWASALRR
jgi:hypothetical protein